jgi:alpha-galactosidase
MKTFQNLKYCSLRTLRQAFCLLAVVALSASSVFALQDGAARTPPMGFNTWNYFGCNGCTQANILNVAKAMLLKHAANWEGKTICLQDVGYKYINLDDCWLNAKGGHPNNDTLKWNTGNFSLGMKGLTDSLHHMGFKAGIYTCAGTSTCAGYPSSEGYEAMDAYTYIKWGFDYLKDDWCSVMANAEFNNQSPTPQQAYTAMGNGITAANKALGKSGFVFSLCSWGNGNPWTWGDGAAHLWRTTGDIKSNFNGSGAGSVQGNYILNYNEAQPYNGPGHWNDPDMLEVGNGIGGATQDQSHFDLWCIAAAPLLMGNNTPAMSEQTFTILSNREVIAVNQDSLGLAGHRVVGNGQSVDIYVKVMKSKDTTAQRIAAVCVVNWGTGSASAQTITWANLGEKNTAQKYTVRDLHTHTNLSTTATGSFTTAAVPGNGTQMLLFSSSSVVDVRDQVGLTGPMSTGKLLTRVNANALECYVPHAGSMVQVFNLSGKEVSSFSAPTANWYKVNSHVLPGTYVVRMASGNFVLEGKVQLFSK